jgi:hypothetical protein
MQSYTPRSKRIATAFCAALLAALLAGCSSSPRSESDSDRAVALRGIERAEESIGTPSPTPESTQMAASVNGRTIWQDDLQVLLAETAGGVVLEEVILDMLVGEELKRLGLSVTPGDVEREKQLLIESVLAGNDLADPDPVVTSVRAARGLGEQRFERLLRRTAGMRKVVAGDVTVDDAAIRQAFETRYGRRFLARIITVPDVPGAQRAMEQVRGEPGRPGRPFGEVAAELSTDASAGRGGLLSPISPADPSYPPDIRAALGAMRPGQTSQVIALESSFAILRLEDVIEAQPVTLDEVRPSLERDVRGRRERVLMDQLARRLLGTADIIVLEPSLEWSWINRRSNRQGR